MRTRSSLISLLFVIAIPLLGAKGGCGGEVSLGDDSCAKEACGGMPELACWDGSSPFTGRCVAKSDGKCGWEPRTCPAKPTTECTTCAIPEIACSDGSSPYTGKCLKNAAGACIAEYKGCGPSECTKEDCGPALGMPSYTCEDGTTGGPTGRCLRGADGKCGWEVKTCRAKCEVADCGAPPPVAACKDGMAPKMSCGRAPDDTCRWTVAPCAATSCEQVEALPRACTSKVQCTFGIHQYNCCGSQRAMGYTKAAADPFTSLEKECRASYPGCGCSAMGTVDDNGKMGLDFDVDCISGACTTFVTKGL